MEKEDILKIPLKEQENLKELFQLLEKNGMEQEKKQVLQTKFPDKSGKDRCGSRRETGRGKGSSWKSEESVPRKSGTGAAGRENKRKGGFVRDPEDHPPAPDDSPCPASPERSSPDCGSGDHETGRYGG